MNAPRVIGSAAAAVVVAAAWLAVLWLLDALFAAGLVGAVAGWAITELVHRHQTRQLNRRWTANVSALRCDCFNGKDPSS